MTNRYVLCTNVRDPLGTPPCAVTVQVCTRVWRHSGKYNFNVTPS